MHIAFCHHLSLSYYGGGEKWLIQLANELVKRGHDVEIYALPFLLDGKPKINPKELLNGIPYKEGLRHKIKAAVCYITYLPLSWLNFKTSRSRIAGMHSHSYWLPPHPKYGLLPNLANITNRFTSYFELRRFDAVHTVTNTFPINHPNVHCIPNFVDSEFFKPHLPKNDEFTIAFASRKVWQKGWDIFNVVSKNVESDVLISGSIPEEFMPRFFSEAHVTIVPSRVDTFGLTIVESMLCGTPVITTPLVTHEALELPLEYASSPKEFVQKINMFKEMEEEYSDLAEDCRKEALKYDKKPVINNLEQMLSEVSYNG